MKELSGYNKDIILRSDKDNEEIIKNIILYIKNIQIKYFIPENSKNLQFYR